MNKLTIAVAALAAAFTPLAASAKPVTDCPNRDTPFSADSPMIDLMLSPAASAIMAKEMPGRPGGPLPANISSTTTPSFMAILTLKEAAHFTGMRPEQIASVDAQLRKLPVTAADRAARCVRYDNDVPKFTLAAGKPHILLFEKINGFKDTPSVNAAHAAFLAMAARKGWDIVSTESAGVFNPRSLAQFDVVIWNNISGDVLTLSQRKAFQRYLQTGGSFVAVHGSAGDPVYFWDWYPDTLLGARFLAHPMAPQFQDARIAVNSSHPLAAGLPAEWVMKDEWYSFKTNPRATGAQVVLSLDESTYKPVGMMNMDLRMGDHPLAWTKCVGKGRMFYSAIGHLPETYSQPEYVTLLENALTWAATDKGACR
jgi:type 1 glutamine amidotransferase